MHLNNDTKIAFCNAYSAIEQHSGICSDCAKYLRNGDGDLCNWAKEAIAMHLSYVDTTLVPQVDRHTLASLTDWNWDKAHRKCEACNLVYLVSEARGACPKCGDGGHPLIV